MNSELSSTTTSALDGHLHVLNHPLASHIITQLRDTETQPHLFRLLASKITTLLVIEATRHLITEPKLITTPLEKHSGYALKQKPLVIVPILRAGLSMAQPFIDLYPEASIGYIGLERDDKTAQARSYYSKLPPLDASEVFAIDPMLATGGSASHALSLLKDKGAKKPYFVCIIAAPEGCNVLRKNHPDVTIFTAVLDRGLNSQNYILPGLGDFGDRLCGT